jgi:hypothetical protein
VTTINIKLGRLSDFAACRLLGWPRLPKSSGSGETLAVCRKSSRIALSAVTLLPLISVIPANPARAAVGDYAGSLSTSLQRSSPVEAIQYYSVDNSNYCWYDAGWQGPGWYSCGYEWDDGLGWGGPYGWNGWGGGHRIRLHGSHGIGVWHHGPATHSFAVGAPASAGLAGGVAPARPRFVGGGVPHFHRSSAPASPGFAGSGAQRFHRFAAGAPGHQSFGGGAPALHGFGGVASASPGFVGGGALALHGFGGVASASPGFVGGEAAAFHGFGGGAPGFQGFVGGAPAFHGFSAGGGFHGGGGGGAFSFGGHGGGGHR